MLKSAKYKHHQRFKPISSELSPVFMKSNHFGPLNR